MGASARIVSRQISENHGLPATIISPDPELEILVDSVVGDRHRVGETEESARREPRCIG